jgi:hypothetical protein
MDQRSELDPAAGGQVGQCRRGHYRPTQHHRRVGGKDGCGVGLGVGSRAVGFADEFGQPVRVTHDLRSAISRSFAVEVRGTGSVKSGSFGYHMHHD